MAFSRTAHSFLRLTIQLFLFFTLLLIVAYPSYSNSTDYDFSKASIIAEDAIMEAINTGTATGATVSFSVDGSIVYSNTFGVQTKGGTALNNRDTQFNVASVSKVFTAVAILQLVEEGKLSLDTPVVSYLPNFDMPLDARFLAITVRMLLNHTSGLPGTNFYTFGTTVQHHSYIDETLLVLKDNILKSTPGSINVYCNDGFAVAEALIARVSDEGSFTDFLQNKIFIPAGLTRTSVNFIPNDTNRAHHNYPVEYLNNKATGGISSTAENFCAFGDSIFNGTLLTPSSITEIKKSQLTVAGELGLKGFMNYGLGWDSVAVGEFEAQGVQVFAKNGGSLDFNSQLYVAPDHNVSIAISYSGSPVQIIQETCNKIMQSILETKGVLTAPTNTSETVADADLPANFANDYQGIYGGDGIFKVEINETTNEMTLYVFKKGDYSPDRTGRYKSDGSFHADDSRFQFVTYSGNKYIAQLIKAGSDKILVHSEMLKPIDGGLLLSEFDDTVWLQKNITPHDLIVLGSIKTGEVKGFSGGRLAGYIQFNDVAYKLTDNHTFENTLAYGRDIYSARILSDNTLKWGNYEFESLQSMEIPEITTSLIKIDDQGDNRWYKVAGSGKLSFPFSDGIRIKVYDSQFDEEYDSLLDNKSTVTVDVNSGDYISFIGNAGKTFNVSFLKTAPSIFSALMLLL